MTIPCLWFYTIKHNKLFLPSVLSLLEFGRFKWSCPRIITMLPIGCSDQDECLLFSFTSLPLRLAFWIPGLSPTKTPTSFSGRKVFRGVDPHVNSWSSTTFIMKGIFMYCLGVFSVIYSFLKNYFIVVQLQLSNLPPTHTLTLPPLAIPTSHPCV